MGAMVPSLHWVPEDDVLLKNAIEAGASLSSLAKGAVQFSRRYTLKELHDRWYSLLYDPVTVMEASPRMFQVERMGTTNLPRPIIPESAKDTQFGFKKRKSDSIRKCYYATRKRISNKPFEITAIDLLPQPNSSDNNLRAQGPEFDVVPEFRPHSADENIQFGPDLDIGPNNLFTGFDESKELPLCDFYEHKGLPNEGNEFGPRPGPFRNHACSSSMMPQMPIWDMSSDITVPIQIDEEGHHGQGAFIIPQHSNSAKETDSYLAEISNTLFEDILFADNNGKETMDNPYYDGLSSLLLDSPSQAEVISSGGDLHLPPVETPTASKVNLFGPEYTNGLICCTLNTEDPDIPSNEDVFLPFRHPSPSNSPRGPYWRSEDPGCLVSPLPPLVKKLPAARKLPPVAKSKIMDSCVVKSSQPLDKCSEHQVKDHVVKFELPKSNINHTALRNFRSVGEGNLCRIDSENSAYISGGIVRRCGSVEMMDSAKNADCGPIGIRVDNQDKSSLDVLQSPQINNNNDNNSVKVKEEISNVGSSPNDDLSCQKETDKAQLSDIEEWSENDVPHFSDVEAMILEMDLTPDESCIYTEVKKYRHEESKKVIIRLEQAADACIQRALSSRSAFALLCGCYSKYFITKPEVILGRSTEGNAVDIDLGREKNGGKISRRQATIKLDMNGIFQLTNLGKHSILVNSKEVLTGQCLSLHHESLIELRGLEFTFCVNRKLVDEYVNNAVGS